MALCNSKIGRSNGVLAAMLVAGAVLTATPAGAQSGSVWSSPTGPFEIAFASVGFRTQPLDGGAIAFVPGAEQWPLCTVRNSAVNAQGRVLTTSDVNTAMTRVSEMDSADIQRSGMSRDRQSTRQVGALIAATTRHRGTLGSLPGTSLRWDYYIGAPSPTGDAVQSIQITCIGPAEAEAMGDRNANALFGAVRSRYGDGATTPPTRPVPAPAPSFGAPSSGAGDYISDSGRFSFAYRRFGWSGGAPQVQSGPPRVVTSTLSSPVGNQAAGCSVMERTISAPPGMEQARLNAITAGAQPGLAQAFGDSYQLTSFTTRDSGGVTIARVELAPRPGGSGNAVAASAVAFNLLKPNGEAVIVAITCSTTTSAPPEATGQMRAILDSIAIR
jgi:hypothetical protein